MPHDFEPLPTTGRLIAVEGLDGSGKSTQVRLLHQWLQARGYPVLRTEWNSSPRVKPATRRGKKRRTLTPRTFSLIHAADLADRWERVILPYLRAGGIVLADRWVFTALARDAVRGMDPAWVRRVYSFVPLPHLTLYFAAPLEVSLQRILRGRPVLKYHEAGMDLGLHPETEESFRIFQGLLKQEYDRLFRAGGAGGPEPRATIIDATAPIPVQQARVRRLVQSVLPEPPWANAPLHAAQSQTQDGGAPRP